MGDSGFFHFQQKKEIGGIGILNVTLCNRGHPEYGAATIPLPIPDEEYAHCMELLEAMEIGSVTGHDCYVDQITDAPPSLDMLEGTMINVDELDFLARSLDRYAHLVKINSNPSEAMQFLYTRLFCFSRCSMDAKIHDLGLVADVLQICGWLPGGRIMSFL